ncbi:MAG: DUF3500 domain-containing protein [Caldilineaceae bacterium SB0666_bin_21]|nr:DUF3500 domain-containing protein [Caldilineaceae bacterium SB0666_bin_21]
MLKPTVPVLFCVLLVVGCAGISEEVSSAESVQQTDVAGTPTPEALVSDVIDLSPINASEADDARGETAAAAAVALDFLVQLDERQREAAVLPYDSDLIRNWSNLPPGVLRFERNGVRIGDLDETQQEALHDFLATAMSPYGYDTVTAVIAAEGVLEESARARRVGWSADNYWLAFFGEPSPTNLWRWQFGGHHLTINMSVRDGRISMSPTFLGIEPARFSNAEGVHEPFKDRIDAGLAVINSLDGDVGASAVLNRRSDDLRSGTAPIDFVPFEGASVDSFLPAQQQAVMDAVALWVELMPEHNAQARLAEIEAGLQNTYFGWHGPTDGTGAIYYVIHGDTVLIEFSTEDPLGADAGHIHSIYRDPTNEYGVG